MTKLNQAQLDLLTMAADADGGAIPAPTDAKATIARLIKCGFVISIQPPEGGRHLMITEAGRAAVRPPGDAPQLPNSDSDEGPAAKGKLGVVMGLLRQPNGVSLEALMSATGWQKHSVRGALAGAVKKKLGRSVISEKIDGVRVYRIADGAAA